MTRAQSDRFTWRGFEGYVFQWSPDHGKPYVKVGDWVAGLWLATGVRVDGHGPTRAKALSMCRRRLERVRKAMLGVW